MKIGKMRFVCSRHGEYNGGNNKVARCPECAKEARLSELSNPLIRQLEVENEQLKQQLKLSEEQQDKLYEKIEDYRELVTLLMKVW